MKVIKKEDVKEILCSCGIHDNMADKMLSSIEYECRNDVLDGILFLYRYVTEGDEHAVDGLEAVIQRIDSIVKKEDEDKDE